MAIFLNESSKVVVQGMTGSEGQKHTRRMIASGTNIVAGVNPRKAGQQADFDGTPRQLRGDLAIGCVARTKARSSGSGAGGRVDAIAFAEGVAKRRGQERVVQRNLGRDTERAGRSDDRVDRILREHAARVDFERVADFVIGGAVDVEAFERHLVDVERVEVEGIEQKVRLECRSGRVDLTDTERADGEARRRGRARTAGVTRGGADREQREVASALIDGVRFLVADAQGRVAAAIVEIGAHRDVGAEGVTVALLRDLVRQVDVEASEVAAGDEVDNARNGVGAVGGRGAAGRVALPAGRQLLLSRLEIQNAKPQLLHVVDALRPPGRLARCLDRRQQ